MQQSMQQLSPEERAALAKLKEQTFSIAFEHVLERLSEGVTLTDILNEYHTPINPAQFRTWVYRDPNRRKAWLVAKAIWAEAMEDELVRIADGKDRQGNPTLSDTTRDKMRIDARQYLMRVHNRRKYGDTRYVEQTTKTTSTLDVGSMSREELRRMVLESMGIMGDGGVDSIMDMDMSVEL
jgi:hypothetical protein